MKDANLLKIYYLGFVNCLDGVPKILYANKLEQKAYDTGMIHAQVGDDCKNIDSMPHEDILKEIKG